MSLDIPYLMHIILLTLSFHILSSTSSQVDCYLLDPDNCYHSCKCAKCYFTNGTSTQTCISPQDNCPGNKEINANNDYCRNSDDNINYIPFILIGIFGLICLSIYVIIHYKRHEEQMKNRQVEILEDGEVNLKGIRLSIK